MWPWYQGGRGRATRATICACCGTRRRHGSQPQAFARPKVEEVIRSGELEINPATRQVARAGSVVPLTQTEFDVLWCLVEAGGHVRSRDQIKARVWGAGHHGTQRTIDNFLAQLRAKLEQDPSEPRHLLTVRGVGYRFQV